VSEVSFSSTAALEDGLNNISKDTGTTQYMRDLATKADPFYKEKPPCPREKIETVRRTRIVP
jgi:hypothetical protein